MISTTSRRPKSTSQLRPLKHPPLMPVVNFLPNALDFPYRTLSCPKATDIERSMTTEELQLSNLLNIDELTLFSNLIGGSTLPSCGF